jgi:aryl-alcohol dehydrogenase-like predicted oxidoreductase
MWLVKEEAGYKIVDELDKVAKNHNGTITQAALNYLLKKPYVSSIVLGARNKKQLKDNLKTTDWKMTEEEVTRLDSLRTPLSLYPEWYIKLNKE